MLDVFEYRLVVTRDCLDRQNHVNNVEYIRWMQDAAVMHTEHLGWSVDRHLARGIAWVVHSHYIQFREPALEGDRIKVVTWVANMRKVRSLRKYRIIREPDDRLLAVAETDWALLRTTDRRPTRIPRELAEVFTVWETDPVF